jgi:hypothetical protein
VTCTADIFNPCQNAAEALCCFIIMYCHETWTHHILMDADTLCSPISFLALLLDTSLTVLLYTNQRPGSYILVAWICCLNALIQCSW